MIHPDKQQHALRALQFIFTRARTMAYEGGDEMLARLMDCAEILPKYLADSEEPAETFRLGLEGIVQLFPEMSHILVEFDADEPPDW